MSHDHYCRLQDIARMLIDAREGLERSDLIKLPDANALHALISEAHWLCTKIAQCVGRREVRAPAVPVLSGRSDFVRLRIWEGHGRVA